jgi:hypothetical protein
VAEVAGGRRIADPVAGSLFHRFHFHVVGFAGEAADARAPAGRKRSTRQQLSWKITRYE